MGAWAGKEPEEIVHYAKRRLPVPIVPRTLIEEVTERVDFQGEILTPLDEADAKRAIQALLGQHVRAIAICPLWSFREPCHEQRLGQLAGEMAPDVHLSISSELAPVIGEYEGTATTAMNAYLGPPVSNYMTNLASSWRARGFTGKFRILDSGGDIITPLQQVAGRVHAVAYVTGSPYLTVAEKHAVLDENAATFLTFTAPAGR